MKWVDTTDSSTMTSSGWPSSVILKSMSSKSAVSNSSSTSVLVLEFVVAILPGTPVSTATMATFSNGSCLTGA